MDNLWKLAILFAWRVQVLLLSFDTVDLIEVPHLLLEEDIGLIPGGASIGLAVVAGLMEVARG